MKIVNNRHEFLNEVKNILPESPICCEIGVYRGEFAAVINEILKPNKLFLIDPFDKLVDPISNEEYYPNWIEHRTVYSDDGCLSEVHHRLGHGIQNNKVFIDRNLSTNSVKNYEDNFFDFIYIDACHLYESAYWDIVNFFPKLKYGGVMSGHDYVDNPAFGVKKAVDEFCNKYGYEIQLLNSESGDWALTNKK
jgi:hypothetical protein